MGGTVKVPPMLSKRCHDCGEVKPATEFWKNKASKDGLAYYCRRCFGLRNSRSYRKLQAKLGNKPRPYRRRSDVPEGMKYCPRCQGDQAGRRVRKESREDFRSHRLLSSLPRR